ncbi:hypothetical protein DXG03_008927 [Asterophora parasitica]|uniref:Uncharacterized protein n=1 Tax=Asterophora parasitica TaxID=117018 RepID=A0A9P7GBQ1_9AGAR|nr:hypothetical protein DXG03_008927 [Asterophora parasitica]
MAEIRDEVERLASLMSEVPGQRYALTLQLMLKRSKKRKAGSMSRSPKTSREPHRTMAMVVDHSAGSMSAAGPIPHPRHQEPFSPQYDASFSDQMHGAHMVVGGIPPQHQQHHPHHHQQQQVHQHYQHAPDADHIWRGFEMTANEQLPVWISDQSLGGSSFTQNGMDAFLLPNDYMPPAPQIW